MSVFFGLGHSASTALLKSLLNTPLPLTQASLELSSSPSFSTSDILLSLPMYSSLSVFLSLSFDLCVSHFVSGPLHALSLVLFFFHYIVYYYVQICFHPKCCTARLLILEGRTARCLTYFFIETPTSYLQEQDSIQAFRTPSSPPPKGFFSILKDLKTSCDILYF